MDCPYLEEVVMVFCRAYPVKKLVPRNRMAAAGPCQHDAFEHCPLFQEVVARMRPLADDRENAASLPATDKEAST